MERRTQDPALATLPPPTAQGAGGRGEGEKGNVTTVINVVFPERRAVKAKWLPEVTRGNGPIESVFCEQKPRAPVIEYMFYFVKKYISCYVFDFPFS